MSTMIFIKLSIFLIIITTSLPGEAYRILGIFPFNGPSHNIMFIPFMEGLASRGHQVDVVGHYPRKNPVPNYRHVVDLSVTAIFNLRNNMTYEFGTKQLAKSTVIPTIATTLGGDLCHLMDLPEFRKIIKNPPQDPPYDIVIIEVSTNIPIRPNNCHKRLPAYISCQCVMNVIKFSTIILRR